MDTVSKAVRRKNMAAIKCKNTKPELALRSYLHTKNIRFRIHKKDLVGKPDLWLKKYNAAVFVHGCFWHQHKNCRYASMPKSNVQFWEQKLEGNSERDKKNTRKLRRIGIKSVTIWECQIRNGRTGEINRRFLGEVLKKIKNGKS